ncbi:hypothetical protein Sango_0103000 [Sesamum angolense]|uniref:Reverse transcriptase n=1 Tax=Sesamum angolense TaxID=2727404 RepID=A0AAE2C6B4_9LAMI|nr:hypothetical protein Sango_0103000 [Sesamum angolense]
MGRPLPLGHECEEVIRYAWESSKADVPPATTRHQIQASCLGLLQWNREKFGNIRRQSQVINDKLCVLYHGDINAASKTEIEQVKDTLEELVSKKKVMWKQQAKDLGHTEGDQNTNFFHAKGNERRITKEITKIKDDQGREVVETNDISRVIIEYFGSLFCSTKPSNESMEEVLARVECRVTETMKEELIWSYTSEGITQALKQMHPLKSPSLNAFVPSYLITDNVLIAYELNHFLHHKNWGQNRHVSLKLDVGRAYDRVEWCFVERVQIKLEVLSNLISKAKNEALIEGSSLKRSAGGWSSLESRGWDTKVAALITVDSDWNEALVQTEFSPPEANNILSIKFQGGLIRHDLGDSFGIRKPRFAWRNTKTGVMYYSRAASRDSSG